MSKYVIVFSENQSLHKLPEAFIKEAFLATFQKNRHPLRVYDDLDSALKALQGMQYLQPIFEVELNETKTITPLLTVVCNSRKITSFENIKTIISAYYFEKTYNLDLEWKNKKKFISELEFLFTMEERFSKDKNTQEKIKSLRELVVSLEGKESYAELSEVLKDTNDFLQEFLNACRNQNVGPIEVLIRYSDSAKKRKGTPLLSIPLSDTQKLGVLMLTLLAAVSLSSSFVPGVALAVGAVGLFAVSRRTGIHKAMYDIAPHVVEKAFLT